VSLHLLYTSDLHNHTGPLDRLDFYRRDQTLLLDGGDALAGSNTAFRWREPILERMRQLGYRAMAMGNREFHYFRWVQRWREQEREFPLLACNLQDLRQPQWSWRSFLEVRQGDLKVGLVGLTPVQYPLGSRWERWTGFRFLDPELCLPPLLEDLRPRVDVLILLSHIGLKGDLQLLERGLPLDLILGGHSHDWTPQPIRRGGTALVHAGANGRYLTELQWNPERLDCHFHPC
jgi:5'-nucleotidase